MSLASRTARLMRSRMKGLIVHCAAVQHGWCVDQMMWRDLAVHRIVHRIAQRATLQSRRRMVRLRDSHSSARAHRVVCRALAVAARSVSQEMLVTSGCAVRFSWSGATLRRIRRAPW